VSPGPPLAPATALTVRQAAGRIVARQVRELVSHEEAARRGDDPEAVHQMRVQTRRLRAALALFSGVVRPPTRAGRPRLRWLAHALGRVRDLDVIIALLEDRHLPRLQGAEAARLENLVAALKERRWRAQQRLETALARGRYGKLKSGLAAMARRPRFGKRADDDAMASRYLADAIQRSARRVTARRGMVERQPSPSDLHKLRITIKRLRYVLDFHAETCGVAYDEERRLARDLQDCLGELHDHDVLLGWLAEAAGGEAPAGRRAARPPLKRALLAGPWPVLEQRLAADRAKLLRRFLRLRRRWVARTEPPGMVAPIEAPRFVSLEAAPVQLRLEAPAHRTVASLRIVR
jgi:CHAD domain-containing protein